MAVLDEGEDEADSPAAACTTTDQAAFLSRASDVLSATLDYEVTLGQIAHLTVPTLADWCVIDLLTPEGGLRRVAAVHADPTREEAARRLVERFPSIAPTSTHTALRVARTLQPWFDPTITEARFVAEARTEEHLDLLRDLGFRGEIVVPLFARGQSLGALTLVATGSRQFTQQDVTLATELARRCAVAIDNARLHAQVRDAIRARDEFVASVTHDLRNPLTAISARVQILGRRLSRGETLDTETLLAALAAIDSTTATASRLLAELEQSTRIEAGRPPEPERMPLDLVALVEQASALHRGMSDLHQIRVDSRLHSIVGCWDPVGVERVLANLLSNAIKFSPRGGDILVELDRQGNEAALAIHDQGIGIPEADIPRLFERYHRGANVADLVAGTGLGLAGARDIVAQHGGRIEVDSVEGTGTTVRVWLPLTPPAFSPSPGE